MKPEPPQQLRLFENFEPSDTNESSSSPTSIARSSSSRATAPTGDAKRTVSNRRARVKSRSGSASTADISHGAVSFTADHVQLRMPRAITGQAAPDPYLQIARPKNRSECRSGIAERMQGNPCPWVGCRYHLLLEVATTKPRYNRDARPPTIRLNSRDRRLTGRRPGLSSSAAEARVRVWLDDALELLLTMEHSCGLDIVDAYPDGLTSSSVGEVFGVSRQEIEEETRKPHVVSGLRIIKRIAQGEEPTLDEDAWPASHRRKWRALFGTGDV